MLFKRRFATTVKNVVEFAMKIDGHSDQSNRMDISDLFAAIEHTKLPHMPITLQVRSDGESCSCPVLDIPEDQVASSVPLQIESAQKESCLNHVIHALGCSDFPEWHFYQHNSTEALIPRMYATPAHTRFPEFPEEMVLDLALLLLTVAVLAHNHLADLNDRSIQHLC